MSKSRAGPSYFEVAISTDEAIERVARRIVPEGRLATLAGSSPGTAGRLTGVVSQRGFRVHRAANFPRFHDVQAFGTVASAQGRSIVRIDFRRTRVAQVSIVIMWVVGILLVAGALVASTQKPVFLMFGVLTAVTIAALLWAARIRSEDRVLLQRFITDSFADVRLAPTSADPASLTGPS